MPKRRKAARLPFACLAAVGCLLLVVLSVGTGYLATGLTHHARDMDPDNDFVKTRNCTLLDHRVSFKEDRVKNKEYFVTVCYDKFVYTFLDGAGKQHESETESVVRCRDCTCKGKTDASRGRFIDFATKTVNNKPVTCYVPAGEGTGKGDLSSGYSCGNPSCIKLFSPHEEAARHTDRAGTYVFVGGILLGTSVVVTIGCIYMNRH